MHIYGYTVATFADNMTLESRLKNLTHRFERLLSPTTPGLEWGGAFMDGYAEIKQTLWRRTAGESMRRRLCPADIIVFVNLPRVFTHVRDFYGKLNDLDRMQVRVILADYGIDTGTPNGALMRKVLIRLFRFDKERKKQLELPKIV